MVKLLVVIPTLGNSHFLKDTLRSIRQCGHCYEVILIHPAGVKLDVDLLGSEILMVEAGRGGLYSAINQAIYKAGVAWTHMSYINDDDLLGVAFGRALEWHISSNQLSFGYGDVSLIDDAGRAISSVPIESSVCWFEALLVQGISPLNQQGMIVPKALWEKLGGFRTEYKLCADLDFWLRAHRIGWPFKYYPLEVGQFRIREGQLSGDTKKLEAEIAAVVARDAPRKIGGLEKFYARWQFRIKNFPIYFSRFVNGRRVRGMKMLSGK